MLLNNYICVLDIGSSKICACVAEIRKKRISNIFFEYIPSRGVRQGAVVNSIELASSVSAILKKLRLRSGIKIKSVYANISGQQLIVKHSKAVIPLAERSSRVITSHDIYNVIEQARILGSNLEEEVIQEIPISFGIDTNSNIINPIGLYSHKLEVDLYLICGKLSFMHSLQRIINQSGYELKDLFPSCLATSSIVFSQEKNNRTEVFCDIGSDITELVLFKNGLLADIKILPIGGQDLTAGLSEALDISVDLAEEIKLTYAVIGDHGPKSQEREVLLKKNSQYQPIKQRVIIEIVTPKAAAICQNIKDTLDAMIERRKVDSFVVVGRTVLAEGFLELLESSLGFSVTLGRINNKSIASLLSKETAFSEQKNMTYITALGMIAQVLYREEAISFSGIPPARSPIARIISKVKEVYQDYF